ncbi:MAG: DUF4445 domain-containing protein [Chloroflexi bacterium]|nr:DUF4445 domain-containing protein [Chloroflexota bacterium]
MNKLRATFYPFGQSALVAPGVTVAQAAGQAGIVIEAPCAGKGTCGRCQVRCSAGIYPPSPAEIELLGQRAMSDGIRLACLARIISDATIEILTPHAGTGDKARLSAEAAFRLAPNIRKVYLPTPGQCAGRSAVENPCSVPGEARMRRDIGAGPAPTKLGDRGAFTAVLAGRQLIAVEKGDTTVANYGIAIDLGTSTVAGYLMDLNTGRQLAATATVNPQRAHGCDVISRIQFASESNGGLRLLRNDAVEAINTVVGQLIVDSGVEKRTVYELTLVGNTAMLHLLLGVDPRVLGVAPYRAVTTASVVTPARDMGIGINPAGRVYVLPAIASFVGADTVGVMLATGMHRSSKLRLAIDLGTNGELVLGSRERLLCCSTAAGPAFEGGRIKQGMCAAPGAIERVIWEDAPRAVVVDNVKPMGICGSGLVDAVAGLLGKGVIDEGGKMLGREPFVLVDGSETGDGAPIVVTQHDVRELQLAKAAIRAGIEILKGELGVEDRDISEVLLAGAFGSYVDKESAAAIGLLPEAPLQRVRAVGNAAGAGAKMALLSTRARQEAERVARKAEYIELSMRPEFQDLFVEAMGFPAAQ